MRIIGLTGGLGTGKSTVAKFFMQLGAKVIDADKIAHSLIKKGGACYGKVIRTFGKEILKGNQINRSKLAGIVFSKRIYLKRLEGIIHPEVGREIKRKIVNIKTKSPKATVILNVPLLFESKMDRMAQKTIVVKANQKTQIERAAKHLNITRAEARRRIKAQMPLADKIRKADFIIDNNGSLTDTKKQVNQTWEKL